MADSLSIFGDDSTKTKIIEVLSKEWPLTAKKIFNRLYKVYKISLTYQAVHKSLKELLFSDILEKNKSGYSINKKWAVRIGEFGESLQKDLESKDLTQNVISMQRIVFMQHSEFVKSHMRLVSEIVKKQGKADMTFFFRHVPYPNVLSSKDIENLKPIFNRINWRIFSKTNTILDRWCALFWRKLGVKVSLGKDIPTNTMMIVLNDYVINVYLDNKAIAQWDSIFAINNLKKADMNKMTETILEKKFKTIVTIYKDPELANLLK